MRWRAARVAWKALAAQGRLEEGDRYRQDAVAIAREAVAGASGSLRDAFASRPDIAELLA